MKLRFFALNSESGAAISGCQVRACVSIGKRSAASDRTGRTVSSVSAQAKQLRSIRTISGSAIAELVEGLVSTIAQIAETEGALVLATARTDRCGYGRIDLDKASGRGKDFFQILTIAAAYSDRIDLYLDIDGEPAARHSVFDGTFLKIIGKIIQSSQYAASTDVATRVQIVEDAIDARGAAYELRGGADTVCGPQGHVADPDVLDYQYSPQSFVSRRDIIVGADGCEHLNPATLPLRQYPIYHVVVHHPEAGELKPAKAALKDKLPHKTQALPSVDGNPASDRDVRWGKILEFDQTWTSLGHSLGEVKYSLPLAPGEAVKVAIIDWKRQDAASRLGDNASNDELRHEQSVDRDIDDIVKGRVREKTSGETFMAGLAAAIDFQVPQSGVSGAVRPAIGYGTSNTKGNRDLKGEAHQNIHVGTVQRSNLARTQNSSVIVQATQSESNYLSTRIVANMNRGHSLTILYYEVLRHIAVRTAFRRSDHAVLVPVAMLTFTKELAMRFRAQIEPVLLDRKYSSGFDAIERLAAGIADPVVPPPPPFGGPPTATGPTAGTSPVMATRFTVTFKTGWRSTPNGQSYNAPADTAGAVRVVARMSDGTEIEIARLDTMPVVYENFGYIFNVARRDALSLGNVPALAVHGQNNYKWTVSYDDPNTKGFCFATYIADISPIDLRKVASYVVYWTGINDLDGWNLQDATISPMLQNGPFTMARYQYPGSAGELFGYGSDGRRTLQNNRGIPLINLNALDAATPASPPQTGTIPPPTGGPTTVSQKTTPPPSSQQLTDLLVNHLNANQYYYSAQVWLNMDARERRLRLASAYEELLGGMSELPFAMSGNHLAFRYSGALPVDAAKMLADDPEDTQELESIVTLPTPGIFAEAHLGHCNAAEKRDITRYWSVDELPVSLLPNIDTLKPGHIGEIPNLTPDQMAPSQLGIQGLPELPAPGAALAKAFELLGKPDIFRDMSARAEVAQVMGELIKSAKPPEIGGSGSKATTGKSGDDSPTKPTPKPGEGEKSAAGASLKDYNVDGFSLVPDIKNFVKDLGLTGFDAIEFAKEHVRRPTPTPTPTQPKQRNIPVTLMFLTNFGKPHDCICDLKIDCGSKRLIAERIDTVYSGGSHSYLVNLPVAPDDQNFAVFITNCQFADPFDIYTSQFAGTGFFQITKDTTSVVLKVAMLAEKEELVVEENQTTQTALGLLANRKFGANVDFEKVIKVLAETVVQLDIKRTWTTAATTTRKFNLSNPTTGLEIVLFRN
ncbi:hypothetical protein [Taklimakanibacter deserti]|uniref:hypothetical protein n=1 Tax=Taklimakanibacter deserti TaxID=2267839 RepID=UPI0013C526C7